jgi:hypothetical protein
MRRSVPLPVALLGRTAIRAAHGCVLLLLCAMAACSTVAASPLSTETVSGLRPKWAVGDWWVVESQVYDHGDKEPGATPGWLDKEAWLFSVIATNAIDGEPCYEVSIKPGDGNRCPYWFSCWFRVSDLLVMRRGLHQPLATRTGRPFAGPVAQVDYSKDEASPFMPTDFPSLPLTTPHFAGGQTNRYAASPTSVSSFSGAQPHQRKSPRSLSGSLTQAFHPNESMGHEDSFQPGAGIPPSSSGAKSKSGVIILTQSAGKGERQSWRDDLPWHVYGERYERGVVVRKSWLAGHGHGDGGPANPVKGGAK